MRTIFKYPLHTKDEQIVSMPRDAKILCIDEQGGFQLCLWAEVETSAEPCYRLISIHGTGHPMDDSTPTYVGTVLSGNGLVWHVYDHGESPAREENG